MPKNTRVSHIFHPVHPSLVTAVSRIERNYSGELHFAALRTTSTLNPLFIGIEWRHSMLSTLQHFRKLFHWYPDELTQNCSPMPIPNPKQPELISLPGNPSTDESKNICFFHLKIRLRALSARWFFKRCYSLFSFPFSFFLVAKPSLLTSVTRNPDGPSINRFSEKCGH